MSERRVIVTGGAGALGKAVRDHFVAAGDRVAVIDVSDEILNSVFPEKEDKHLYLACDLTDRDSCVSATEAVVQAWGGVDVLCNIAGGFMMGEKVHETTDQTWNFLFELNTRSVMHMVSAVVPAMLGSATTVVIASGYSLPVSTTHTLVGGVLGVGLARGIAALNLKVVGTIFASWLITLPAGAILAIIFFYMLKAIFGTSA